ncbi:MAG: tetratricopeptide repeat protein [Proteobacteria bacterium]|nr:tetratricopeptide repeat protein [Pseudomonadota bacterium]MBU4297663.1 tetratricopeptide repeat protein [Pseudomonadota bacterium]MCG2748376.1 tetratricopeptide repeat protein [Desulfobulbaceae bacterium]
MEGDLGRALRQKGQPFLWVVDDLASGLNMEAVRTWQAPDTNGKTLITTRSREYGTAHERLDLEVLAPDEALQFFLSHRSEQHAPLNKEDDLLAREIAINRLGCHALGVDVAGSSAQRIGYGEFLQKLDIPDEDALELAAQLGSQLPNGHEKDIAAPFLRSIALLDEAGLDYLRLAACLATAPILRSLVSRVFARVDGLEPGQVETRALLATDQAARLSLAEDQPGGQDCQTVHLLISRTVRFHDPSPERAGNLRNIAVAVLTETLAPIDDIRSHADLPREVEHSRHLCRGILDDVSYGALVERIARHDFVRGSYVAASILLNKQMEVLIRILGEEHPNTLASMNNLAETLRAMGNLSGARELQEKTLEVLIRILGEEHPVTLTSMNNLAGTLRDMGNLSEARALEKKALEVEIRVLGEEHPNTLSSMNNLAVTLQAQGDLSEARALQEKTLEIRLRILGEEHPNTLESMNNLAETLRAMGNLSGARELQEKTLEVQRRILGEEHPNTTISAINLFLILIKMQNPTAKDVLARHLLWLLQRDPADLSAIQRQIREKLQQLSDHFIHNH